jgi:2-methylcitrate dehydratase
MSTVSQQFAEFSSAVRFEDLPEEVVAAVRRFVYDSVGCAFGGVRTHDYSIAAKVDRALGGEEQCTIIGAGRKANVLSGAFLNALAVRALDYNDIYWKQDPSHPSDIIPGVWACGELVDADGEDVVTAIVLAYELEMRLCEAAFPGIRERGWHHATLTAFAAAAACARVMGLSAPRTAHAIGIAGSRHATLGCVTAGKLTMMKNTVDPMATQAGAWAALLAAEGYEGPEHVFCGKEGLSDAYGPEWKLEILTDGLGDSWRILDCGMKAFPTEALTHAPISCVLEITAENQIAAEDVAEVRIQTLVKAADILSDPSKYDPRTRETADHSLPYCIAAALAHGRVTPELFEEEAIADPRVRMSLEKIKVSANMEFEAAFPEIQRCHVALDTTDGRSFEKQIDFPIGDPRKPMSSEQMDSKFEALCGDEVSEERRTAIRAAIECIGDVSAREFMDTLAFSV